MKPHFLLAAFLTFVVVAPGCASGGAAFCQAECDCHGCSQAEYNNCAAEADGAQQSSDYRGCDVPYQNMVSCHNGTGFCRADGHYETNCHVEEETWKSCMDIGGGPIPGHPKH